MVQQFSRRHAVKQAVIRSTALAGASSFVGTSHAVESQDQTASPNEEVRIAVIGVGNRSRQLMSQLPKMARIVAICDCDRNRADAALKEFKANWPVYDDHRKMFEREKLDGVIVGTPDHGRSLPCIEACQAEIDVYAEKPLTAYVQEGRAVVDAARKYNRIFQVGTQQRTMEVNEHCCRVIREGQLGTVQFVQAVNYTGPQTYLHLPEQVVPAGTDWNRWCGPTPLRPYHRDLQFGWMRWRAYSGGEMTNWGAHGVDQIQWALGKSLTGPTELTPVTDGPNGKVTAKYSDGIEVRFELEKGPMGGAIFHCEQGKIEVNRNRFASNPAELVKGAPDPAVRKKWELPGWIAGPHLANWIECMKTRQRPNADVEVGHRSITFCHLVNITRELGRTVNWDPETEQFVGDDEANGLLSRPRRTGYELPET